MKIHILLMFMALLATRCYATSPEAALQLSRSSSCSSQSSFDSVDLEPSKEEEETSRFKDALPGGMDNSGGIVVSPEKIENADLAEPTPTRVEPEAADAEPVYAEPAYPDPVGAVMKWVSHFNFIRQRTSVSVDLI